MRIKRIHISNYKSYDEDGVSIPISNITGLIGPNSAGKSNVLNALDIFFNPRKLEKSDFYKYQIEKPIIVDVTFCDYKRTGSLEEVVLFQEDEITLRRIYAWNENKEQAEADKNLYPSCMWTFNGNDDILNPFPREKIDVKRINDFLAGVKGQEFLVFLEQEKIKTPDFNFYLKEYWNLRIKDDNELEKNFEWKVLCGSECCNKDILDFIKNIELPEYIYLSVEHTISDEMSLKKGSRFDNIFSMLMKMTEQEQDKRKKSIDRIKQEIDKYYKKFYDVKLEKLNLSLKHPGVKWDFSESLLKIERETQDIDEILQPSLYFAADDGFLSKIDAKGNGVQRLAVFQLLQTYADIIGKESKNINIIFAIEEPEIYLHPPYKRALYKLFRKLSNTFQIIYTTHDPIFVQLEYFDEIRIIRKDSMNRSCVRFVEWETFEKTSLGNKLFGQKRGKEQKRQELFNKCHGEQNEGFFADKIILVEGNTEIYALPIYFEMFGFNMDSKNIALISCTGVTSVIATYIIFTLFGIPVYIIFDGDKPKNDKELNFFCRAIKIGEKKYRKFIEEWESYKESRTSEKLEELKRLNKEEIIPNEDIDDVLTNGDDAINKIDETIISISRFEEIKNKHLRNMKIQRLFNITEEKMFTPTNIHTHFTKWEYDFESNVSEKLFNYNELKKAAVENSNGKPLVAKLIAMHVTERHLTIEIKTIFEKLINAIRNLNDENIILPPPEQRKVNENLYKIIVISDEEKEKKCYKVFSCAAGFSNPQIDTPMAYAYGDVPEGTEYIIKVNGDSMEPEIPDGAYVPIKIDREYLNNKIGIFYYDGNSICKKYTLGKDNIVRLISINKKYEPIEIKEYTQLECNGKVICGKDKKPYILKREN